MVDWENYYDVTKNRTPREVFSFGLRKVPDELPKIAIDIGFGAGNEVLALLNLGWKVVAIDAELAAAQLLKKRATNHLNLTIITDQYQNITFPKTSFVHAGFSLPFCSPRYFDQVWEELSSKLFVNGIFAGQLFGVNDEWKTNKEMSFHRKEQIQELFAKFEILKLEEHEGIKGTATGGEKYWHYFDIIAKKIV